MGTAIGLAMAGWRPVCEMQYDAFSYPALDQLINHVGRYRWRTRGSMEFPITVRMPYGGGVRAPELHDDSPETYYVHTPGVRSRSRRRPPTPRDCWPRPSAIPIRSSSWSQSSITGRSAERCRTGSTSCRSARRVWRGKEVT